MPVQGFDDAVCNMKRKSRQRRSWGYLLRLAEGNCRVKPDLRILLKYVTRVVKPPNAVPAFVSYC
jgi:hypothetical protein